MTLNTVFMINMFFSCYIRTAKIKEINLCLLLLSTTIIHSPLTSGFGIPYFLLYRHTDSSGSYQIHNDYQQLLSTIFFIPSTAIPYLPNVPVKYANAFSKATNPPDTKLMKARLSPVHIYFSKE